MSDPYRQSPEVIERTVEVPVDRIVEKIVYKEKIVEKIPKCQYARCSACKESLTHVMNTWNSLNAKELMYSNKGFFAEAKSTSRQIELIAETYSQLILRKCEH